MTGMQGEAKPAPALGEMTTSELQQRRRELEDALKDKAGKNAPVAADLQDELEAVEEEEQERREIAAAGLGPPHVGPPADR